MSSSLPRAWIGFLWPHPCTVPAVARAAARSGTRGLLDLRRAEPADAIAAAGASAGLDLCVRPELAADAAFRRAAAVAPGRALWVDFEPFSRLSPPEDSLALLKDAQRDGACIPITGDLALLSLLLRRGNEPELVALKGSEAAGFGSPETAWILLDAVRRMASASGARTASCVFGGVATPEAAAALLCTGAGGVVCENVHWLTDLAGVGEKTREGLRRLHYDCTRIVGDRLGAPCRVFDRGNSAAARALEQEVDTLSAGEIGAAQRRAFVSRALRDAVPAVHSALGRDDLVFLGPEAAFTGAFVERFGEHGEPAIAAFAAEVERCCGEASDTARRFLEGEGAGALGTRYPFVQGGMSWITDVPEFAAAVADAGALPTLAVGMRSADRLDSDLGRTSAVMGRRPFALNLISLRENPFREEQALWVERARPAFAVIAGGDPTFISRFREKGIRTIYLVPDEGLLRVALKAGTEWIVLEGCESGGHVGIHSTLTLAQILQESRRREPGLFRGTRAILAGGICDAAGVVRAALLGADAVQMGTVYLATREIVDRGALSPLYQRMILASAPGGTSVVGRKTGLMVRSLETPRVTALREMERLFAGGAMDESAFRRQFEELAAGSLLVAARGVRRPGGEVLPDDVCRAEGQFMSGAAAGAITEVRTLEELHRDLASGTPVVPDMTRAAERVPRSGSRPRRERPERIAITGMSVVNALGREPEAVWQACVGLRSGIVEVPLSRWDHARLFDPDRRARGKTYCPVGAFADFAVSRQDISASPQDFRTMAASTRMTLWLAAQAVRDAGLESSGIPRERVSVLISQNSGECPSTLPDLTIGMMAEALAEELDEALGLGPEKRRAAADRLRANRLAVDDSTLLGRLNSSAAGFVSNRYGLRGPSYAVSAACATGLVAMYSAIQMIRNRVIDAAVVGGAEEVLTPSHFLEFSALGALAGCVAAGRPPGESSRPFDATRDGMVLGEGGAVIVIERESVARRRGAPILAFITGAGASNNDRGMVESLSETQQIALRAAFADAGYGAETVDLVECHATSTAQGDIEEVKTLKAFFPRGGRVALSSFKSQIGHTLGAAGLNSLARGVLAMRHGVLPPTPTYREPDAAIGLEDWGFDVPREPREWKAVAARPRRALVNAFGFGGSNYTLLVEESRDGEGAVLVEPPREDGGPEDAGGDPQVEGVVFLETEREGRAHRVGVLAESVHDALARMAEAQGQEAASPAAMARHGVFAGPADAPAPAAALVFAGQGSHYAGMGRELYETFPGIRRRLDRLAEAADFDLLGMLFRADEKELRRTLWQQPTVFALEYAVSQHLLSLGLRPVAVAGHSLGELAALCLAGVYTPEDGLRLVSTRARCMDRLAGDGRDPGTMIAVDVPRDVLDRKLAEAPGVCVANHNSPRQLVLGGPAARVLALREELEREGYWAVALKVSMAFHSAMMHGIREEMSRFLEGMTFHAPVLPVISNTTARRFPDDPAEMRHIVLDHMEKPVLWMQSVRVLRQEFGVGVFVEVGPKDTLSRLIADTVEGAACEPTCSPDGEAVAFRRAAARLYAAGCLRPAGVRHAAWPTSARDQGSQRMRTSDGRGTEATAGRADDGVVERVIAIIMAATGYERSEIRPDMDIRSDLAVRSSRLPVIMDAAEKEFGIRIALEEVIGVRTVQDIADRIAKLSGIQGVAGAGAARARPEATPSSARRGEDAGAGARDVESRGPVRRFVLREAPLAAAASGSLPRLGRGDAVAVLHVGEAGLLGDEVAALIKTELRADVVAVRAGESGWDAALGAAGPLSGLAIVAGGSLAEERSEQALCDVFAAFKRLTASPSRSLCLLAADGTSLSAGAEAVAEGALGLLAAARLEYSSLEFHGLRLDAATPPAAALGDALRRPFDGRWIVYRGGQALTEEAVAAALPAGEGGEALLPDGAVVLLSGGGRGITPYLAEALAVYRPRLVLLGRTPRGGTGGPAAEVGRTLERLAGLGLAAEYRPCDVTDAAAVRAVADETAARLGRIDAVIHGAGVLADGFVEMMSPAEFRRVVAVKLSGLRRLYEAARPHGLRAVMALSSVAALRGNLGQANYCAANRAMAALLRRRADADGIRCRTVWLPPVEGAGMADAAEVRELLTLRGMGDAYVGAHEIAGAFEREAGAGGPESVVLARSFPGLPEAGGAEAGRLEAGVASFARSDLPLVDTVERLDLGRGVAVVSRAVNQERDLWLADHKPVKGSSDPLFSGVMAVESLIEAAQVLFPHLRPRGLRDVEFRLPLGIPAGQTRVIRCESERTAVTDGEVICAVRLSVADESAAPGAGGEGWLVHFRGNVVLGVGHAARPRDVFRPIGADEMDTGPVDEAGVSAHYDRETDLGVRYRVTDSVVGTGPHCILSRTVCRGSDDFSGMTGVRYRCAPYVLEALIQLSALHPGIRQARAPGLRLPAGLRSVRLFLPPAPGDLLLLSGRLVASDGAGETWDCAAFDAEGAVVMAVEGLRVSRSVRT